jgi:hypothetical protein
MIRRSVRSDVRVGDDHGFDERSVSPARPQPGMARTHLETVAREMQSFGESGLHRAPSMTSSTSLRRPSGVSAADMAMSNVRDEGLRLIE